MRAIPLEYAMTFLEISFSGDQAFTTVFYRTLEENFYFFVHSRHTSVAGAPVVSQTHGFCASGLDRPMTANRGGTVSLVGPKSGRAPGGFSVRFTPYPFRLARRARGRPPRVARRPLGAQQERLLPAPSNGSAIPVAAVGILTGDVGIDGRLDEPAWDAAPVLTGFVQSEPLDGAAATRETEARVLIDDQAIYSRPACWTSRTRSCASSIGRTSRVASSTG